MATWFFNAKVNFTLGNVGVVPPSTGDRVCPCTGNTPRYLTVRGTANFLRLWRGYMVCVEN